MEPVDDEFSVFHGAVGVLQIHASGPDRLDLGAEQLDARLQLLQYKIVVVGLAVYRDLLDPLGRRHGNSLLSPTVITDIL
jgi:hypothetical protein